MFETGSLQTTFSNIFYFLPSTADRSKEINRYLGSVNLSPINVPVTSFEVKENVVFDPSKLDFASQEKEIKTGTVVKVVKKIVHMSNAKLFKNADGLLSKFDWGVSIEWSWKNKTCLPQNKYKMTY